MMPSQQETEKSRAEAEEGMREQVRFCVRRLKVASPEFQQQRRVECENALQALNPFIKNPDVVAIIE